MNDDVRKNGLAPVYREDARVLILGSMPGEQSLQMQQYYAYPRNQFWRMIADIRSEAVSGAPSSGETEPPADYGLRLSFASDCRIALWDVIGSCLREGSLDTNIREELPNDIPLLLDRCPDIAAVFFNGGKAASSFKRHFGYALLSDRGIDYEIMPSTSPAHTMSYQKKYRSWRMLLEYIEGAESPAVV